MEYPLQCFSCGALLMGGLTQHAADCDLVKAGIVPGPDGKLAEPPDDDTDPEKQR